MGCILESILYEFGSMFGSKWVGRCTQNRLKNRRASGPRRVGSQLLFSRLVVTPSYTPPPGSFWGLNSAGYSPAIPGYSPPIALSMSVGKFLRAFLGTKTLQTGSGRALGASWRLQKRFKSARTQLLASWEFQEGVWRPQDGILVHFGGSERVKMWDFGAFWRLREG